MDNILNIVNEYSIFIVLGIAVIIILLFIIVNNINNISKKVKNRYRKMMRGNNRKKYRRTYK